MSSKPVTMDSFIHYSPLRVNKGKVREQLKFVSTDLKWFDNTTLVGIEVEVEDIVGYQDLKTLQPVWSGKDDGSLRGNSREYVSTPINGENIPKAVELLYSTLAVEHPGYTFSERTGIHVHLNARKFSAPAVVSFLLLYTALEKVLFQFAGAERSSNLFCVPLQDTVTLRTIIRVLGKYYPSLAEIEWGRWFSSLEDVSDKYSALNLKTLFSFGTFEFRHLEGTANKERLMTWINLILRMKKFSYRVSPEEMAKTISGLTSNSEYEKFLYEVFDIDARWLIETPNLHSNIECGVLYIKEAITPKEESRVIKSIDSLKQSILFNRLQSRGLVRLVKEKTKNETSAKAYSPGDAAFVDILLEPQGLVFERRE